MITSTSSSLGKGRVILACLSFVLLGIASSARAQTVGVDATGWGPMDGFELYGNGIYWWNDGTIPDEIIPARTGQIAIRSLIAGSGLVASSSRPHFVAQSTELRARFQSAARSDDWMFYFSGPDGNIRFKKKGNFGPNPILNDFSGSFFHEAGAILLAGPTVYWAARGGHASNSGEVRWKDINGPLGGGDVVLRQGMGLVKKMKIITVVEENGGVFGHYFFMLNTDGQLWHVRLPGLVEPTFGPLTLYATDITDFDSRVETETFIDPPFVRRRHGTRLYAGTGVGSQPNLPAGKLLSFNLTSGGTSVEYPAPFTNQVTSVAVDNERIFITDTPVILMPSGQHQWNLGRGALVRRFAPVNRDVMWGNWGTIASHFEGRNLRTDTNWLYFAHQNEIRKIKTDAPDLQLDYRAIGLEAVQAVQDFNNSISLIAGKTTLVRGYAQVVVNTTSRAKYRVTARLRAFRNGVQLAGEVDAYSNPINLLAGDLPTLRANWNRAFLFEVPSNWIDQPGSLELQMMVNADGTAPETGSGAPFANNVANITVNVVPARVPCLVFKPMSSPMGNYDPNAPGSGFWDIVDRATSLLPVSGFKVYFSNGSVRKPVFPFDAEAFSMPGDQYLALMWMTLAHAFTRDPNGCADTHWVGMFPPNVGNWNGLAGARGVSLRDFIPDADINITVPRTALDNTSIVRMNPVQGSSSNPWSTVGGGETLAHELAHNYGRLHIDQTRTSRTCPGSRPLGPYHSVPPGIDPCTLGIIDLNNFAAPMGYDVRTDTLVRPDQAGDLMTYANSSWISPFTWNALVGAIPVHVPPGFGAGSDGKSPMLNPQPLPPGGIVLAQGIINPATRNATLMPTFQIPNGILDDAKIQESLGAASLPLSMPYKLRLLDAAGTVLDERAIIPLAPSEMVDGQFGFVQAVPNLPGATRVQVVHGSTVLNETMASQNAPTITLATPIVNVDSQTLSLQWTASDADQDPLLFSVQYSPDNGVSWESLSIHDPALGFTVSTRQLRGGAACQLRVIATDGFRTTMATTGTFNVPKHIPALAISGVREQQQLPFNSNVIVRVFAYDAEDGAIESDAISWSVTGPETRSGGGGRFSIIGLAPGNYTLTASARDIDGNTGSTALAFQIRPIEVLDGASPVVDGILDEVYPDSTEVRLFPGKAAPSGRLLHVGGALYVCFDGLPYSDPNAAPANINFYIDGDGVATAAPQANDTGFGVDENGIPARARGTGAAWTADPPQGFEVKILRAAGSWSAEFRVPDGVLGGWNRSAAITFWFGISPGTAVTWPASANVFNPSTWTALSMGPLPAVTNRLPVAVASAPSVVSFTGPEMVNLDGSGSYDLDGDPLSFSWTQTSGPSVVLANASTATPSFQTPTLTSSAFVTFQLVVGAGVQSSSPQQVTVLLSPGKVLPPTPDSLKPVVINVGTGSARIQLSWPGTPGSFAVIQASSNLVHWVNIATNSASFLGALLHTDLQAGQHPRRFYRAVSWDQPDLPLTRAELTFDGVDDRVAVPHSPALNSLPLTITAWFRTTQSSVSSPGIVTKFHGDDITGYGIALDRGHLTCWYIGGLFSFIVDEGADSEMPFVADGRWHHVAFVVDSSGGRVHLDGSLVRFTPWEGSPTAVPNSEPLRFGQFPGETGMFYNGDLDEVALWSRALGATEINQMIPGQLTGNEVSLLGCWKFNDGTGTVATDSSPNGRHGTLINGPQWNPSTAPLMANLAAGSALRFDGTDDSVQVAHDAALNPFPLTVAAWVKTAQNSPGYVAIANKYAPGSANGYSLHIHHGRVAAFYFRDGTSFVYANDPGLDGGFIADGQWHHVAYMVDGNGGRIFVDGIQTGSLGWTGTAGGPSTTTPLLIGRYPLANQTISLDGRLDELTIWNRALDATEVYGVMNNKQAGTAPGLLGYWPFDNGAGASASDVSGHGHTGSLLSTPLWVPSDAPIAP